MRNIFHLVFIPMVAVALLAGFGCVSTTSPPAFVLDITQFGGRPDSGQDVVPAVKAAIAQARALNGRPVVIRFPKGTYDFWAKDAGKVRCPITGVHQQWDIIPGFALLGMKHVTVDGGGSEFIFHSRMTPVLVDKCEDVVLRDFTTDFSRPSVSEMTVKAVNGNTMDVEIHPDSKYVIRDNHLWWVGPSNELDAGTHDMQFGSAHLKSGFANPYRSDVSYWYDPATDRVRGSWNQLSEEKAVEIGPNLVRLQYAGIPDAKPGLVAWGRSGLRKQDNLVFRYSKNVLVQDVTCHFWDTFLVNGTVSENLTFVRLRGEPRAGSGRTCAGFADGIHLANCSGHVRIEDCRIVGLEDDYVNIYGNQLVVTKREKPNQVLLRYIQWEQCGFDMLFPGDKVQLLRRATLQPFGESCKVVSAELLDRMTMRVVLDGDVPEDCVKEAAENVSRMPEVLIRGCYFARTPTRGALLSSWRKTVVEDNTFKNTGSPAIFCNTGDSYGQQGAVKDLTIRRNFFSGCSGGVFLKPEQSEASVKNPIMENVVITGNTFSNWDGSAPLLWARSARAIRFLDNTVQTTGPATIWLGASSQVTVKGSRISSGKGRIELAGGTTAETVFADAPWVITR
ncbi:MAG TPA: hypothetical protein VK815_10550 [Candidatus Acidoferrales bacterium]|nr:hypothetical protein [Candidatus Acidoferrales bacterium]